MDKNTRILEIATRILELYEPWEREDLTPAEVARVIKADPIGVMEQLVDTIEHLHA